MEQSLTSFSISPSARRWSLILPAMLLPLVGCFFYFVWFPGTTFGNSFYVGIKTFLLLWPFIMVWWILKEKFEDTSRPSDHKSAFIVGGAFGLLVVGVMFGLMKFTPLGDLIHGNASRINARIEDLGIHNPYLYLLFALFVSFFHAALEEFFWRYFAFGQLKKLLPVAGAVTLAAIGFALHHIVVMTQFVPLGWAFLLGGAVGLGGAVWSIIYHRYNSIRGAWFSHMLIDLGIMWIGWEILQMG